MRFEGAACERREGVDTLLVGVWSKLDCGDHARRELRVSWLVGIGILRTTSKVARHRICSRALARQAMCDAPGDGTESDEASMCQRQ
jgi:hypothetical protein